MVCQATFGTLEIVFGQRILRRLHYLLNIFGRVFGVFVASVITLFIMGVLRIHLKRIFAVIMGAVFTAAALIRCVVFWMNPPAIFGTLSYNENVCDMTDRANILFK